ncbi:LA_3751/LA_3752 family putative glycosyltransferase [Leptospira yasudae]|uniref:Glycosyltransferase RgtA/B/C/D-like domain-containing protein n=1 Tax=Leptospira yasudae TaxID=2202201 RepID=A0A6N4QIE1_9LEPT|nr:hypothetical protein [Leptospira yasudae]TGL80648.1 hypothetical protein EHQ77_07980 [Leptospira yasudae]TGL80847.1 hypothetical protein EHQ72_06790 [Leptospira yasudae]TGL84242.1 hypothetical protein EHQ83_11170 [Leptospira yasudae]
MIKKFWAICILLIIIPILHFWIGTGDFYIADSLLKAMQTDSLIQNNFKSEALQYPAQSLDPKHSHFFLNTAFADTIRGKFIGAFPVAFSLTSGLLRKAGLSWTLMPFVFSLTLLLSFYILSRKNIIGQRTVLLGYGATILSALSLDYNEYSVYFLLNAIGFAWWMEYRDTRNINRIYFSIFVISASIWFRLESMPFLLCLALSEIATSETPLKDVLKNINWPLVLLGFSPLFLFLLWNYLAYDHFLGARFLFNFRGNGNTILDRVQNFFSMALLNYVDKVPKFGLFFCSSYLLLPFVYYIFHKQELTKKIKFLIFSIISYVILIGLSAPNDGITITGRYMMLVFLPLLMLWEGWNPIHPKKWRIASGILIVLSILISGITLKIIQQAAKQERTFREFYVRNEAPLWLFTDPILCGQAGLEHLSKKILCLNPAVNRSEIVQRIEQENSLTSFVLFEMNEKESKAFANAPSMFSTEAKADLKTKLNSDFQAQEPLTYKGAIATRYLRKLKK